MDAPQLLYALALQNAPNIGDVTAKKLIQYCGSPEAVLKEKKRNLLKINGFGNHLISGLLDPQCLKNAEAELKFIEANTIKASYFLDAEYPSRLKHCIDGPIVLFQSGNMQLEQPHLVSIVGTRKMTAHGREFCEAMVTALVPYNPVIVSGMAYGVDITAQRSAVENGLQTVGCMAHGLDQMYPKPHERFAAKIKAHGGFVTDFWSTDAFDRKNFLKRNRLIAGLTEATIVIESAEKGGSLVTAQMALSYNREVFAVPGRITDAMSIGCNNLLKYQKAHVLTQPEDIPFLLNWQLEAPKTAVQKQLFVDLEVDEQCIYDYLYTHGKALLDIIALQCQMPVFRVASLLLNMELKGVVRPLPGKQFEVI